MLKVDILWSKGVALYCDHHGPPSYPQDATESWQGPAFFQRFFRNAGGVVWIRLSTRSRNGVVCDLDSFVTAALPHIQKPFVLITTDGDACVPLEIAPGTVSSLLDSPLLVAWFTQNHDGIAHPKLHPWPIGLDLHSPLQKGGPRAAIASLMQIRKDRDPIREAPLNAFCDFDPGTNFTDRQDAVRLLRDCPHVTFATHRVSRAEIWRRYAAHPFVLSAHGNGLDCHRTYEILYPGSIVITKRSSLDPLFDGLPVACVNDWCEVLDLSRLDHWRKSLAHLTAVQHVWRLLSSKYWIARARQLLPTP
jgi:hypothetical protein